MYMLGKRYPYPRENNNATPRQRHSHVLRGLGVGVVARDSEVIEGGILEEKDLGQQRGRGLVGGGVHERSGEVRGGDEGGRVVQRVAVGEASDAHRLEDGGERVRDRGLARDPRGQTLLHVGG